MGHISLSLDCFCCLIQLDTTLWQTYSVSVCMCAYVCMRVSFGANCTIHHFSELDTFRSNLITLVCPKCVNVYSFAVTSFHNFLCSFETYKFRTSTRGCF